MRPSFFAHPLHFSLANSLFNRADLNSSLFCRMLISSSLSDNLSVAVSNFSFLVFNSNSRLATCLAKVSKLFRAMTEGVEEDEELLEPSLDEEDDPELSKLGLRFSKKVLALSQCGNFRIFLSFRFYVKSILENLEVLQLLSVFALLRL